MYYWTVFIYNKVFNEALKEIKWSLEIQFIIY